MVEHFCHSATNDSRLITSEAEENNAKKAVQPSLGRAICLGQSSFRVLFPCAASTANSSQRQDRHHYFISGRYCALSGEIAGVSMNLRKRRLPNTVGATDGARKRKACQQAPVTTETGSQKVTGDWANLPQNAVLSILKHSGVQRLQNLRGDGSLTLITQLTICKNSREGKASV